MGQSRRLNSSVRDLPFGSTIQVMNYIVLQRAFINTRAISAHCALQAVSMKRSPVIHASEHKHTHAHIAHVRRTRVKCMYYIRAHRQNAPGGFSSSLLVVVVVVAVLLRCSKAIAAIAHRRRRTWLERRQSRVRIHAAQVSGACLMCAFLSGWLLCVWLPIYGTVRACAPADRTNVRMQFVCLVRFKGGV